MKQTTVKDWFIVTKSYHEEALLYNYMFDAGLIDTTRLRLFDSFNVPANPIDGLLHALKYDNDKPII